jgi:beta-lactamase superfamily II metal-dependent hydrolase
MINGGLEIDFLQVGDGERSGDAIALRYGNPWTGYEVMVIDGGNKESGAALVNHITGVYGTRTVQNVLNSHPDGDHSSGLTEVLERLDVKNLWMHRPWAYAAGLLDHFRDPRFTPGGLEARIREALDAAHDLEKLAVTRGIPIYEPFQGSRIGPFLVLSPERGWYLKDLVPNFSRTPAAKQTVPQGLLGPLYRAASEAVSWVAETLNIETLDETGETSAQNESSTILYGNFNGQGVLFTGDAGRLALTRAILYANSLGLSLRTLNCVQIPHHGSRRNVSPSVLNEIIAQFAIVSVATKSTSHPRRKVTNAFKRRGARVFKTDGGLLNHAIGWPQRQGLRPGTEIPFYDRVEAQQSARAYSATVRSLCAAGAPLPGADRHPAHRVTGRRLVPRPVEHVGRARILGVQFRCHVATRAGRSRPREEVGA